MAVKLGHKSLTEAHDLIVAAATDREVGTTLATTHGQRGKGVLESLFKTEELQDAEVHGGMEAQTTLVRANGTVKLNTITNVDMDLTLVIGPRYTESNDAFRFNNAFNKLNALKFWVLVVDILDGH